MGSLRGARVLRGTAHTLATREKIARRTAAALERKRRRECVTPGEIRHLERQGTIAASLRPYARQAADEADGIVQALGGPDLVSEQCMALIQDFARTGLLLRAVIASIGQGSTLDLDVVGKASTLIGQRRSTLQALGLGRRTREIDLASYLASKAQAPTSVTNGADPEPQAAPAEIAAQTATQESAE